jgi:PPOX class probable F420-dependent enzyme
MAEPIADRPHMPGYGTLPADEGGGLLPWSWVADTLASSHDYWVATVDADGAPAVSAVWGVWLGGQVWFSCGRRSRKARNLERDPRVTVTNDTPAEQVVVEGRATRVTDLGRIEAFVAASNAKYAQSYGLDFYDPDVNGTYAVAPVRVIALKDAEFEGSPTRWRF